MTVSAIVRCRNEEAHIGRLLTGLLRQRQPPDEIVVVDSGSTDATQSIASAFPVEIVHIAPEDFSFGAACNLGMEASSGDLAVFVSAHCYPVYDSWLTRLTAPFDRDDVALSYGRQVGPPDANFSEQRLFARWFPAESAARQLHPFCNNANAAVRRRVWEDTRYDERLTGLEDLDWAKRVLARGHVLSYVAEAPVVHVHHETLPQIANRYRREAIAHKQIYHGQRMSLVQATRLAAANVLSDYAAARREGVLRNHLVEIPKFRAAQFAGTYRGFAQHGPVPALLRQRFFYPPHEGADATAPPAAAGEDDVAIDYDATLDHLGV